jgi:hypothetical protein
MWGRLLETASNPCWVSGWFLSGSQKIQRHNSKIYNLDYQKIKMPDYGI